MKKYIDQPANSVELSPKWISQHIQTYAVEKRTTDLIEEILDKVEHKRTKWVANKVKTLQNLWTDEYDDRVIDWHFKY